MGRLGRRRCHSSNFCTAGGPPVDAPIATTRGRCFATCTRGRSVRDLRSFFGGAGGGGGGGGSSRRAKRAERTFSISTARTLSSESRLPEGLATKSNAPNCSALKTSEGWPHEDSTMTGVGAEDIKSRRKV